MLRERGYEVAQRGCALLGYVAAGGTAGVCLATRMRKKATLPGGHAVYLVTDSQWVLIPLQVRTAGSAASNCCQRLLQEGGLGTDVVQTWGTASTPWLRMRATLYTASAGSNLC